MKGEHHSQNKAGSTAQYATFYVDGFLFGIEVQKVQEIIRYQHMTRVPLSSPIVEGLINLRGQIITAIDLRRRLDLHERPSDQLPMNVVVRSGDGIVSLLVDEIGDVLEIDQSQFEETPATVNDTMAETIHGVSKLDGKLMLALNVDKAVTVPSADVVNA